MLKLWTIAAPSYKHIFNHFIYWNCFTSCEVMRACSWQNFFIVMTTGCQDYYLSCLKLSLSVFFSLKVKWNWKHNVMNCMQMQQSSFKVYMLIQIEYEIPYIVTYLKFIVIWHNSIIAYSGYLILYRHTTISIQFAFNCRSYFPLKQATLSKARKTFVLLPEKNRIERLNLSDSGSQWGKWA